MNGHRVILVTGIPRSGTSLLTKILSKNERVLCLSEPRWLKEIRSPKQNAREFIENLLAQIKLLQQDIKEGNPIEMMLTKDGELPDNYYLRKKDVVNVKKYRQVFVENKDVICIKSNALFTSCLQYLADNESLEVISVVRDPIAVLMSWRSLNLPISKGLITIGEQYSPELKKICREKILLNRQILILEWFFRQYEQYNRSSTLRYEDFVKDPEKIIKRSTGIEVSFKEKLYLKNRRKEYKKEEVPVFMERFERLRFKQSFYHI